MSQRLYMLFPPMTTVTWIISLELCPQSPLPTFLTLCILIFSLWVRLCNCTVWPGTLTQIRVEFPCKAISATTPPNSFSALAGWKPFVTPRDSESTATPHWLFFAFSAFLFQIRQRPSRNPLHWHQERCGLADWDEGGRMGGWGPEVVMNKYPQPPFPMQRSDNHPWNLCTGFPEREEQ